MNRSVGLAAILAGVLVGVAPGIAMIAGIWLLPSIGALLVDRERGCPLARAMTLFGLAAAFGPLWSQWLGGGDYDDAFMAAANPMDIARCWSAQATAWMLAEMIPFALATHAARATGHELRRLEAEMTRLQDEWSA